MKRNRQKLVLSKMLLCIVLGILLALPALADTTTAKTNTTAASTASPKVTCPKTYLRFGDSVQLKASNFKGTVSWTSSDTSIATISSTGLVKVVANKSASVRFTAKYGTAFAYVTVPIRRINLNWSAKTLKVGESFQLILYNAGHKPGWKTANTKVAAFAANSITADGKATIVAKGVGKAVVTATYNNVKFSCLVTVTSSGSSSGSSGKKNTQPSNQNKKKETRPKYTVTASTDQLSIQTAGYVDVTATGEKNLAIECDTNIVTGKFGDWGTGDKKNTIRVYFFGVNDGSADVRIRNKSTNASAIVRVNVQAMKLTQAQRREKLGELLDAKNKDQIRVKGDLQGYRYYSYVAYNKGSKVFTFRAKMRDKTNRCTLKLVMNKKFTTGTLTATIENLSSKKKYTATAKVAAKKYTDDRTLKVTVKKNPNKVKTKTITKTVNTTMDVAMKTWDLILRENCSYHLAGIGFDAYRAG